MSEIQDLWDFRTRYGMKIHQTPTFDEEMLRERIVYLREELQELEDAIENQDLVEVADALVDLVYIAKGSALGLGLAWAPMWDEVQRSNMSKEVARTPAESKRGIVGDVYKPEGWKAPDIATAMHSHPGNVQVGILTEAAQIIDGRDQESTRKYGPMEQNLQDAAQVAAVLSGWNIRPRDVLSCLVGLKFARHRHHYKRDNLLDAVAYLGALDDHLRGVVRDE